MIEHSGWKPSNEQVLKDLIRQTIQAAGDLPVDQLPHLIRNRLKSHVLGDLDIDTCIQEVMKEMK